MKELVEKLGRNDLVRADPGSGFKRCCRNGGKYDGANRAYYIP